ncbi:hypothetical protein GCM10023069_32940 [Shinella granuli]|jgi:hypothetical protein|uniref:Uncharacterized protein n=2 Tax=Shinella granuli TaxID=323621 RepID=A0A4R2CVR2_SHIGR|nr:hypothetical protein EV665_10715 [Shinella granuli]
MDLEWKQPVRLRCDHHGTMIHVVGDVKTVPALLTMEGPDMATLMHPVTGVKINPVIIERKSLTFDEAVTAHIMRMQGVKYNIIAQQLGTNTHRLGEVFRGEKHSGSKEAAIALLRKIS